MNNRKLLVLVGPTAVGKTAVALRLAAHFQTEIISADSRQVYKELEIGTARPSKEELIRIKHHFIGCRTVADNLDAGTYGLEARKVIDHLFQSYTEVILCGGSGLYVKAILEGFDDLPAIPTEMRSGIIAEYERMGLEWLKEEVRSHDPGYFEVVDRQNPQRLMRALEIIRSTGLPYSGFRKKENVDLPFGVVKIGLTLDRDELYRRIDQRVDEMIARGLFEEAESLFSQRHLNALQTVGYQEIFGSMDGSYDREEAIRLIKQNTRRYAKRQLTWFKKDKEIRWFSPEDWEGILAASQSTGITK